MWMFVENTKLGGSASCEEDAESLQRTLVMEWANSSEVPYNEDMCEVIHFSGEIWKVEYHLIR